MTLTLNDTLGCLPHNIEQKRIKLLLQEMCKIAFTYNTIYQVLTPFLPSYSDKNLLSPLEFCIFAPAIEGTAYCAETRS